MNKKETLAAERRRKTVMSVVLAVICIIYVLPVLTVVINSFKVNTFVKTDTFALPAGEMWAGFANFVKGMTFGNYPFWNSVKYSVLITVASTALILLFVFSMVVPFQMVMFTLSKTADSLHLNTPWTIPIVYLGFGAGLAIFMFVGFVKSIPLEIEEAASIDGCGPVRTYFSVVLPMLKPTMISVGILEIMWVWNDYLLPYLVLDINEYRTIPIHIQYLKGSYGTVDLGATMPLILLSLGLGDADVESVCRIGDLLLEHCTGIGCHHGDARPALVAADLHRGGDAGSAGADRAFPGLPVALQVDAPGIDVVGSEGLVLAKASPVGNGDGGCVLGVGRMRDAQRASSGLFSPNKGVSGRLGPGLRRCLDGLGVRLGLGHGRSGHRRRRGRLRGLDEEGEYGGGSAVPARVAEGKADDKDEGKQPYEEDPPAQAKAARVHGHTSEMRSGIWISPVKASRMSSDWSTSTLRSIQSRRSRSKDSFWAGKSAAVNLCSPARKASRKALKSLYW